MALLNSFRILKAFEHGVAKNNLNLNVVLRKTNLYTKMCYCYFFSNRLYAVFGIFIVKKNKIPVQYTDSVANVLLHKYF